MTIHIENPSKGGGGGATDHAALSNLDYASANHTGFEPSITTGTIAQFWRGDKTFQTITTGGGGTLSKSFVITNPTTASDLPIWRNPVAMTITHVHLLCQGQTISGQLWEYDANGLNGSTVDDDIQGIVNTNVDDDGSLSNAGIAAGNYLGWKTTSATAGATYAIITVDYTIP